MSSPAQRSEAVPAALIRAIEAEARDAETAGLIADFGQPNWPGWRWLMFLLLLAQLAILAHQAAGHGLDEMRPRPDSRRPPIVRVVRAQAGRQPAGARAAARFDLRHALPARRAGAL